MKLSLDFSFQPNPTMCTQTLKDKLYKTLNKKGDFVMNNHKMYKCIVKNIKNGRLREPFNASDVYKICNKWKKKIWSSFLPQHRVCNPNAKSILFVRIESGKYSVIRPFKYGLNC